MSTDEFSLICHHKQQIIISVGGCDLRHRFARSRVSSTFLFNGYMTGVVWSSHFKWNKCRSMINRPRHFNIHRCRLSNFQDFNVPLTVFSKWYPFTFSRWIYLPEILPYLDLYYIWPGPLKCNESYTEYTQSRILFSRAVFVRRTLAASLSYII